MGMNTNIAGCSAFGLRDAVVTTEGLSWNAGFFLADALLPGRPFGAIRTGMKAEAERIHSGLPWPPEAQVHTGMPLRRAPISCVWRSLVEAVDEQARWKIGEGISFPLARILAAHVLGLMEPDGEERTSIVIAIPNDLDELGQESLLYELDRSGFSDARLVWRPIASALTWLEDAGQDIVPQRLGTDDFILVLHMGPDAVECTSFRVKVEEYQGLQYVVPKRKRPKSTSELTGFDWACCALDQLQSMPAEGVAEFWQAFTAFPEIWQCMANIEWKNDELPRIWGHSKAWSFWNPNREELVRELRTVRCGPSRLLRNAIGQSCQLSGTKTRDLTWPEQLKQLTAECLEQAPPGKLIGMIVDGPLALSTAPLWLRDCFPQLEKRGLDTSGPYDSPELGKLWCAPGNTAIAKGAAIFGRRLKTGEPTYLDALPQLSLLVKRERTLHLFPLVDAEDVRGGQEYTNSITDQFVIEAHQAQLDVILYRGGTELDWLLPASSTDLLDSHVCSTTAGLALGASSMARHLIRVLSSTRATLSSLRTLPPKELSFVEFNQLIRLTEQEKKILKSLQKLSIEHGSTMVEYIKSFQTLYDGKDRDSGNTEKTNLPLKKVSSIFPLPPPRTMPVDINVRISPASGRAKMEVIPEEKSFLRGRHVFVDYATMEDLDELPTSGQGWPSLEELTPHSDESVWNVHRAAAERFLNTNTGSLLYDPLLDRICSVLRAKPFLNEYGVGFYMVNQEGSAGCQAGMEIVQIISRAVARHAESLMSSTSFVGRNVRQTGIIRLPRERLEQLRRLIVRGSWLMGATPEPLLIPMRYVLQDKLRGITWGMVVDAAGRAFTTDDDLSILLQAVVNRIAKRGSLPLPMQSINALCRVLMYRPNGQDVLDEDTVYTLLEETCNVLDQHSRAGRFKAKFFQGIRLLLYLLRCRKRHPGFLEKESRRAQELMRKLDIYESGLKSVLTGVRRNSAVEIIAGIKDFVNFAGSTAILPLLTAMAEDNDDLAAN